MRKIAFCVICVLFFLMVPFTYVIEKDRFKEKGFKHYVKDSIQFLVEQYRKVK